MEKVKICLLDDDALCVITVGRLIAKICKGCDIKTFVSPQNALAYYDIHDLPDFILSDLKMPKMDGVSFIDKMRGLGYCGPAYIVTGWLEPIKEITPISGVIQKPIKMDDFRKILSEFHA